KGPTDHCSATASCPWTQQWPDPTKGTGHCCVSARADILLLCCCRRHDATAWFVIHWDVANGLVGFNQLLHFFELALVDRQGDAAGFRVQGIGVNGAAYRIFLLALPLHNFLDG